MDLPRGKHVDGGGGTVGAGKKKTYQPVRGLELQLHRVTGRAVAAQPPDQLAVAPHGLLVGPATPGTRRSGQQLWI